MVLFGILTLKITESKKDEKKELESKIIQGIS
jgi:hypothetical protein